MIGALWIGRDQAPDWGAAARSVRDLRLATVYATGDDFFPWETWLADVPDVPHPLGVYLALRTAQARLKSALEATRAAVERGTHHMLVAELPDHRVYVAGGQTAGGPPPDPWEDFTCFAEGGLAAAAGFAGWTRSCPIDLARRALVASARQRRSMAATRALLYAEDLAHEEQSALGKLGASTHAAWTAPLRSGWCARRADRQIRALMLFAARTYALLEELWHEESSAHELPAGVPRVVWETTDVIDETAIPRRRSHDAGAVLRKALAIADTAAEDLALLDDPDSEDAKQLERVSGRWPTRSRSRSPPTCSAGCSSPSPTSQATGSPRPQPHRGASRLNSPVRPGAWCTRPTSALWRGSPPPNWTSTPRLAR